MAPVALPLRSKAMPLAPPTSTNRARPTEPSLRKRKFATVSFAIATSTRPSSFQSPSTTPSALPIGFPVLALATANPLSAVASTSPAEPSLRR